MKNERGVDIRDALSARHAAAATIAATLEPEDQARADFYALLARLYADAPDAPLLAAIAAADAARADDGESAKATALAAAWEALRAASAVDGSRSGGARSTRRSSSASAGAR